MKYRVLDDRQFTDFCMLMMLLSHTESYIQEWMPKDRSEKLDEASRLISEVIASTIDELSKASAQRLRKSINEVKVFCLPKPEAERAIRQSFKTNTVRIREEAYTTLLEMSVHKCAFPCGRNYKACILRKILLEIGAQKHNPKARGYCPYERGRPN